MSPTEFSFEFHLPDPAINSQTANSITLPWQQNIIRGELQTLSDAFGVAFHENAVTPTLHFGGAQMTASGLGNAVGIADKQVGGHASVWVGIDRPVFNDPTLFAKATATGLVQALTLADGKSAVINAPDKNALFPSTQLFSIEDDVALATKFGTTFHLAPADKQIANLYLAAFGRMPDHAGLDVQLNAFHSGTTAAQLANAFLNSAEGIANFGTDRGASFVGHAYQNILGRQPDPAGERVQVDALAHGMDAGVWLVGMANSAEALHRFGDGVLFT